MRLKFYQCHSAHATLTNFSGLPPFGILMAACSLSHAKLLPYYTYSLGRRKRLTGSSTMDQLFAFKCYPTKCCILFCIKCFCLPIPCKIKNLRLYSFLKMAVLSNEHCCFWAQLEKALKFIFSYHLDSDQRTKASKLSQSISNSFFGWTLVHLIVHS